MHTLQLLTLALVAMGTSFSPLSRADVSALNGPFFIESVYAVNTDYSDWALVDLPFTEEEFLSLDFGAEVQALGAPDWTSSFWLWNLEEDGTRDPNDPGLFVQGIPPAASGSVPEPSTLALLITFMACGGAAGLLDYVNRRCAREK